MRIDRRILGAFGRVGKQASERSGRRKLAELAEAVVSKELAERGLDVPRIAVRIDDTVPYSHDVRLRRAGGDLEIGFSGHNVPWISSDVSSRLVAYVFWLLNCSTSVEEMTFTMSDGDLASEAIFSPSTYLQDVVAGSCPRTWCS